MIKESEFTERELLDIQKYISMMNNQNISESIKSKLSQTPPPKYFEYLTIKENIRTQLY